MKRYLIVSISLFFLISCGHNDSATVTEADQLPDAAKLLAENKKLKEEASLKDSSINAFINSFNEIEENLLIIKEKEKMLSKASKNPEFKDKEAQIVEDIQLIAELMERNRQKIASINDKLKKANLENDAFEKVISRLNSQIEEQDNQINSLKDELMGLNSAYKNLFDEYNQRVYELDQQTQKLNTAYYVFGTYKELKEHGIISKEGGFIGIGKTAQLMQDFNKAYFTKIDVSATTSIPIYSKKAKVLTSHPSGSYQFEGEGKVDKMNITNPNEFWASSRYLVIVVE